MIVSSVFRLDSGGRWYSYKDDVRVVIFIVNCIEIEISYEIYFWVCF